MTDPRIAWLKTPGPAQQLQWIGVLEVRADGACRAVFADRVDVDGRCHILLAREGWGGKDARETRWWSLVLDARHKVFTVRNGSCGDALLTADVPRVMRALEDLALMNTGTMVAVDDGPSVLPGRALSSPTSKASTSHAPGH